MSVFVGDESGCFERMVISQYGIRPGEIYDVLYYHFNSLNIKKVSYKYEQLKEWIKDRRSKNVPPMTRSEYVEFLNKMKNEHS